jgi:lipopolysaccharide transport system ATP-binding protein
MVDKDLAVKTENLSKCYRIGVKERLNENLSGALWGFLKTPVKNYRKYRSLYHFEDVGKPGGVAEDVIWALRDVSFEVRSGEALGIIGRNGAGKSTLLKVLSRITTPSQGRAEIRGKVASLLEVGTGFHPELSGRENVYLNGTILGMKKREVDRKFDEIVDFSGIEKFIDTPVKRYSSGMKVRLAFSVAAHLDPDILVVDEVLAVGDDDFQRKCLSKMEDVEKGGRTVLFVSHNMPSVMRLCDRVLLIDEGRIAEDGPAKEVVSNYLCEGRGIMAVREWQDPQKAPAGDFARLRAVRIRAEEGQIVEKVDVREPFRIELEFDSLNSNHILLPYITLRNERGEAIFTTVDRDPEWRNRNRRRGRYVSSVRVPGNLLAEGMVHVNCHLRARCPDLIQFSEYSAVVFYVVDGFEGDTARGDWAKGMAGVVRPMLDWETQYHAEQKES